MKRHEIADIAAKVAGAAVGVLIVGLLIGGVLGQAFIYGVGLMVLALLALGVLWLVAGRDVGK
jgi:hypothetical protein